MRTEDKDFYYPLTLKKLQNEVESWSQANFPNNTYIEPLMGMVEELGELHHAVLKSRQGIRGTEAEHREAAMDALGDLFIYAADFAARSGYDLQAVIESTWDTVKKRNWQKNPLAGV